ncbi:MAG: hypothetical protein ACYTFI_19425 [Planctomycetota bacterium]|jgi:hypothetical protein
MDERDIRGLKFRYLLWLYKTTKEALDRTERKFTQLEVDRGILQRMEEAANALGPDQGEALAPQLQELRDYVDKKERDGKDLKFDGGDLKPEHRFLVMKLESIEKVAADQLGREALDEIRVSYEREMRRRILESKGH